MVKRPFSPGRGAIFLFLLLILVFAESCSTLGQTRAVKPSPTTRAAAQSAGNEPASPPPVALATRSLPAAPTSTSAPPSVPAPTLSSAPADPPQGAASASPAAVGMVPVSGGCRVDDRYQGQSRGEIRGRVINAQKQPVASAAVLLLPGSQPAVTDAQGQYIFANLEPAYYAIFFTDSKGNRPVGSVKVSAGMVCFVEDYNLSSPPAGPAALTVQILYQGQPAAGALFWFQGDSRVLVADANGRVFLMYPPLADANVLYQGHWAVIAEPIQNIRRPLALGDAGPRPSQPAYPQYIGSEQQPFAYPRPTPPVLP